MSRRTFVWAASWLAGALGCRSAARTRPPVASPGSAATFDLQEWTIAKLQAAMTAGELTAVAIAEQYLARIEALDRGGPALRSIIELNPEALDLARALDDERRARGPRGPLHGIPIVLKDNLDTGDRMLTTAGSLALVGAPAARDAAAVARLRAAGAVLLAKTNLSEWANFRSTRSTSGWSARGGQCRNPYDLSRNPCGSSSGSGVAASANLCAAAIGTETDGSIVCPASANGIVGIKPTLGLVSQAGIIPIAHSQDTAGPMARTVADAAAVLGAIAEDVPNAHRDYTPFLDAGALRGARLGVARKAFGFHADVDAVMEQALDAMRGAGAVLVDVELAETKELGDAELLVLLYEFKHDLDAYLAGREGVIVKSLADLIAFNQAHPADELVHFGQELFEMAAGKGPLTTPEYVDALATCRRLSQAEGIDAAMDQHQLDAIVAPTNGPAWQTDLVCGNHYGGGSSSLPAVAGYPNVTVPAGFVRGLPIGASFYGRAWSEPRLLAIAYAFEQLTAARKPPALATS